MNDNTLQKETDDLRIREIKELLPPAKLIEEIPVSAEVSQTVHDARMGIRNVLDRSCLLYTSPSPRDGLLSRMPSSA